MLVPGTAHAQTSTSAPVRPPKAWILVDADSRAVLDARDERRLLPAASLTKVVTALATVHALAPATDIPVTARAAGMPARKINMKAGQVWTLTDTLHAMMLSSANDAAVALAERVSGRVEAFATEMERAGADAGMEDSPVLQDPSGLDDEFSVGGGNLVSARDLAIATRALLAEPVLADMVARREYRFLGGDGIQHRLINHNRLLRTYPGAVGVKTGYTKKSGHGLIAAARRNGRTIIVVVIDAIDTYGAATALLDKGFATSAAGHRGDRLPDPTARRLAARGPARGVSATRSPVPDSGSLAPPPWASASVLVLAGGLAVAAVRRRADRDRRERRRRIRHELASFGWDDAELRQLFDEDVDRWAHLAHGPEHVVDDVGLELAGGRVGLGLGVERGERLLHEGVVEARRPLS